MKRLSRAFALLAALAFWLVATAWAEVPVPTLQARVTDLTGTLSASERRDLESDLQGLEERTGSQLAVLLVPTTQPEAIEQFSLRVVEAWKLGRKGKDNGVLLLVAKNDRRVRIEVGYGLEGSIPDAVAKRVIDEAIVPRFKESNLAGGVKAGVERLAALIEGRKAADRPADGASAAAPTAAVLPSRDGPVMDLTGSLSGEHVDSLGRRLRDFYDSGRTKPAFVLVIPSAKPESVADYAARTLAAWGTEDNLDVDRSVLLVMAKDDGVAYVAAGAGLKERILPGAAERLAAEVVEPLLKKGDVAGAAQTGVEEMEKLIDGAINNQTWDERLIRDISEVPVWLIVAIIIVGTAVRWLLGPFFGGLAMGGAVGAGAWFVTGVVGIALAAGVIVFIFVLVGLANWIGMAMSGSSSGGSSFSSGGFSGGGGDFGGGGASGSW